ncbi:MAG: NAD(P)/FAD-dependent oxidoreductase [Bacteroidota bacterium]
MEIFDITIIGAGPVGLFSAYYAGLRGMKIKLIDTFLELGGQLTALYPEKYIYDVAGFPKILARDLAANLIEQAMQYHPTLCLNEHVISVRKVDKGGNSVFHLTTDRQSDHWTRSLLITAGVGSFAPKKLELPEAAHYEGKGILYFIHDIHLLEGKKLLIVGGGDSAIDWALNLIDRVESMTLIHRRDQFRAHDDNVKKLYSSRVAVKTFSEIRHIYGGEHIERATIINTKTGVEETLDIDFILPNFGFIVNIGPLKDWGLEMERNDIKVNRTMETNIPGIFAAGDIATYAGKLKLIATGFGEGVIAVNSAKVSIDPRAKYFPGHSSAKKHPL